jgi:hypothetical protein
MDVWICKTRVLQWQHPDRSKDVNLGRELAAAEKKLQEAQLQMSKIET